MNGDKHFSDEMNRNCLDLILGTSDRNYGNMDNLRSLDSAVNETLTQQCETVKTFILKQSITPLETYNLLTVFMEALNVN